MTRAVPALGSKAFDERGPALFHSFPYKLSVHLFHGTTDIRLVFLINLKGRVNVLNNWCLLGRCRRQQAYARALRDGIFLWQDIVESSIGSRLRWHFGETAFWGDGFLGTSR